MLRWRVGQAQGQVGIAAAQVGEGVGGRQFKRQGRIGRHELGQGRQQQAVQHGIGTRQPNGTADHLLTVLQRHPRGIQGLFGALGLLGQGLGGAGGDVAFAALYEQRGTEGSFHAPDRAEHRRNIHPQQLCGLCQ
ncbi:hypothetical protein D9M73_219180 [compost metagenome]